MEFVFKFISSLFMMSIVVYSWHRLLEKKFNTKSIKLYIVIIVMTLSSIFNYYIINQYIRILVITVVLIGLFKFLFKGSLQKCIITPVYTQLLIMISEMIFAIIISIIFKYSMKDIAISQFGSFSSNFIISIISLLLIKIPLTKKIYSNLINTTDKITRRHLIVISFISILIANILSMILYYKIEFVYLLIFNTGLTLFCFGIVLYSFKTRTNYIKVYDKYNTTLNSLKEYEDILDRYRVSNHENKNQLLTIRNMLPKSNIELTSYIDRIVNNKLKDNDKIMLEASIIPTGGLRGLIYSKVLIMKEKDIKYDLEISNQIRRVDLIHKIADSTMLDVCQIIGVYIDNGIEEVEKLKEKYINIEMYLDNKNLVIEISNNYENKIEIDKLENKGYTTKKKGHGYGLTLTKEIIEKNELLSNEKRISKESFTQVLKIKM